MATQILFTVDTELTWRHHVPGRSWADNYALSVEPAGVGLSWQLEQLAQHKLKGIFFIDPMPALAFGIDPIERMVATVLEAGQEVQLHLHPMWADLDEAGAALPGILFELNTHDFNRQRALIEQARALIVEAGAPDPIAFRAGSFAVNDDTIDALAVLGIEFDSSHNGCEAPWPSGLSLAADLVDPVAYRGVVEIPVSQLGLPGGGVRHAQICAASLREMGKGLDHAIAMKQPLFVPVCHSFELATRDGRRVNQTSCSRFEGLCDLLVDHREVAPTVHFADLHKLRLDAETDPVSISRIDVAHRMAQQLWSNIVEERGF